jgi:ABC-type transporter Mla subunit MlaD
VAHSLDHLDADETRAQMRSRARRNLALLALLAAFVLAVFAFSLVHIQAEMRPVVQHDFQER